MKYDPRLLLTYYNRLAPRERLLLGVALLSLILISLYNFVWDPLQTSREQLTRRIAIKEKELAEIQKQREIYLDVQRHVEASQPMAEPKPSLFAYLDNTIAQAVGREHITSMNPTDKNVGTDEEKLVEKLVEIRLTQISLPQLVDLLYRVEKGEPPLRFSRLQVKKRPNDIYNFDVTATVSFLKAAEKAADKTGGS
jgi:hypothetical protein